MPKTLVQIDENTYRFNRLIISKDAIETISKTINANMTEEKLRKIHNIIMKSYENKNSNVEKEG